jgi:hypothetical protein
VGQDLNESILNSIQCIGLISQEAMGDPKGRLPVTAEQILQRLSVAGGVTGQELLIARRRAQKGLNRAGRRNDDHGVPLTP